ncbi:MAG: hypothetical protein R2685_06055 [Candidatus Nitrosocosmicus sp.]|nr:hypothetical protein [Candidatus Nitrosocosmicus sp.]
MYNRSNSQIAFGQTNNTSATNQTSTQIDSFRAQGQISSLASDTLAGRSDNMSENAI